MNSCKQIIDKMPNRLIYDIGAVFDFVCSVNPLSAVQGMQAIGLERNGELVAGVVYEGYNKHNIWMHVGAAPGKRWMTREYLKACFAYPFLQCGVSRISGYVNASNLEARKFDEHLGFKQEAILSGAAPDGGDVIIYVMRREDCKYVD